jgi:hypothetical protein
MSRARSILALAGFAALAAGCTPSGAGQAIEAATNQLFDQVAAKQYAQIYEAAAPEVTKDITEDLFVGFMQRVDRRLGACQRPVKAANWSFNSTTSGYFTTQGYTATCANGQLTLLVTMVVRQGAAKLAGYQATSPLLLTD